MIYFCQSCHNKPHNTVWLNSTNVLSHRPGCFVFEIKVYPGFFPSEASLINIHNHFELRPHPTLAPSKTLFLNSVTDWGKEFRTSTGKYWIPIWNILESHINLTLAHPKYTKSIKGKKTAKTICVLFSGFRSFN